MEQIKSHSDAGRTRYLADLFREKRKPLAIICRDIKEARLIFDQFQLFLGVAELPNLTEASLFEPLDVLPYYQLSPNPDILLDRLGVLTQVLEQPTPKITLIPLMALGRRLMPVKSFRDQLIFLQRNTSRKRDALIAELIALGYQRSPIVEDRGTFAVRGGILDVFPPAQTNPVRVEFFDDEIESLRSFELTSQKSISESMALVIPPARELLFRHLTNDWKTRLKKRCDDLEISKKERDAVASLITQQIYFHGIETYLPLFHATTATILDYLPSQTQLVFYDQKALWADYQDHLNNLAEKQTQSTSLERIFPVSDIFATRAELTEWVQFFDTLDLPGGPEDTDHSLTLMGRKPMAELGKTFTDHLERGEKIFLVAHSPVQKKRLEDLLQGISNNPDYGSVCLPREGGDPGFVGAKNFLPLQSPPSRGRLHVKIGNLNHGFYWPKNQEWWVTDQEIFGQKISRPATSKTTEPFFSFEELSIGDFVVHEDHGVGQYQGLQRLKFGSFENDFIILTYLGGDKLYVPADQLDRVSRYTSQEGHHPLLDKMGGYSWQRVREKVKKATRKLARQLLELQAIRAASKGHAFTTNTENLAEFSATFPFTETNDQWEAISAVFQDMESDKPMDRLVCGDVGYGKTEVALRASYKAVLDQKQVALLVPTTVLAFQHFRNFKTRLEKFPVTVGMLSRFQSEAEQQQIITEIKQGKIDIVIGTHRLLSKDIRFRDLGLLVVDEEQHFGVAQKERVRQLARLVDTLTLTATPIPRTLNFALTGIRDLSVIQTPPADRLAIRTYTIEFNDAAIKEAIEREIKRGGQIYFVHNRVKTILGMKQKLEKLLPEVKIEIGHGQMPEDELEKVMVDFMQGKFPVLLCTTIIESGLDIPSVNTIIIDRADHFGLAQLYQLRGRVGRSNHRAYCYLIVPSDGLMTAVAKKRLRVIQKFTDLGSGFRIASHDLEIRGAGNILGAEQSGHIAAVGYDLYVKLLQDAVYNLKETGRDEEISCEIKLPILAVIPETLVPDTQARLVLYKQLTSLRDVHALEALKDEWLDRLGALPEEVVNLIELMKLKTMARRLGISSLIYQGETLILKIHQASALPIDHLIELAKKSPKKFQLQSNQFQMHLVNRSNQDLFAKINELLSSFKF